eukprot:864484_1
MALHIAYTTPHHDINIVVWYSKHNQHWKYKNVPTISALRQFISIQFNIQQFELTYNDQEGHPSMIVEDNDLKEALKWTHKLQIYVNDEIPRTLPLCQFAINDICGTLKHAMHNDLYHKANSARMEQIFTNHELSGENWMESSAKKGAIKQQMLRFMTETTFNIIFQCFDEWKENDKEGIRCKSATQIARILYDYPLKHLIDALHNDSIDGQQIIHILNDDEYIQSHTGWDDNEVEQIKLILLRYFTFTQAQFIDNMNMICEREDGNALSKSISNAIKDVVLQFDMELLHFNIKNNKNIGDSVVQMVNEIMIIETGVVDAPNVEKKYSENDNDMVVDDTLVKTIYDTIAKCFIHTQTENAPKTCNRWICSTCGNDNFCKYINGAMNYDLSVCSLCGETQIDSIVHKLRNYDSFLMVNDHESKKTDDPKHHDTHDDIDKLIQDVVEGFNIKLYCPSRNDLTPCPSIIYLAKQLILHNRWLHTVIKTENVHDVNSTSQV